MESSKPQQYTGVITKKLQLTKTVFHFFIDIDHPVGFTFVPGQYGTFIIDEKNRRQYSFCSAPSSSSFELVIDVSPMGPGSTYFLKKNVGDTVEVLAPLGNFMLSKNSLKKVFVATGTGIAPFRSMLLEEMKRLRNQETKKLGILENSRFPSLQVSFLSSLYWGLRYEDDVYWDTELKAIAGQLVGFQYFLSLSKPSEQWGGLKGHVTQQVFQHEKNPQNCEFYLCGNTAMITEMQTQLSAMNVPKEQVKIDQFY